MTFLVAAVGALPPTGTILLVSHNCMPIHIMLLTFPTPPPIQAMKQQQHEPHKKGPTVITTSSSTINTILAGAATAAATTDTPSHSNNSSRPLSFGAAPAAMPPPPAAAATSSSSSSSSSQQSPDFDVVMCGGTLGICVALALQQKGFRVAVVEKRRVEGRLQEWNSSRHEVQVRTAGLFHLVLGAL